MNNRQIILTLVVIWVAVTGIALGYTSQDTFAQAGTGACQGVVMRDQLPVRDAPTWFSGDLGRQLANGQLVSIRSTHYRTLTGEIWYEIGPGEWVQAYSGHTTGLGQVIAGDALCMMSLPHQVSVDLPPQLWEGIQNSGVGVP